MKLQSLPNLKGLKGFGGESTVQTGSLDIFSSVLDAALSWKDVEWLRPSLKFHCW